MIESDWRFQCPKCDNYVIKKQDEGNQNTK